MIALRPLQPADTMRVWEAYQDQPFGPDLHDDQATAWSLTAFDRMLWRAPASQFVLAGGDETPRALGRLVEIDFRN